MPVSHIPRRSSLFFLTGALGLAGALPLTGALAAGAQVLHFTDVTLEAGLDYQHGYETPQLSEARIIASGVAAGDVDGDGWVDLYVVRGDVGANLLLRNRGDGTFEDVAASAGVAISGEKGAGPALYDLDGDGHLDLFVGGIEGTTPRLFRGLGNGTFEERTDTAGIEVTGHTFGAAFGDLDRDGDLDMVTSHWSLTAPNPRHVWLNEGDFAFTPRPDAEIGLQLASTTDFSFTWNAADLDGDGWLDLLLAGDFGTSRVYRNLGGATFEDVTTEAISDENGMGAAVADFDQDGDLDWFVSSIWDPNGSAEANWGVTGNRLYRNRGDGTFDDVTEEAGVRRGYWGWGSCFADFDNDGRLDLFHVNGFQAGPAAEFHDDPSRLFLGEEGGFVEASAAAGLVDTGQGRAIACFDYDRDGDIDLFVANNSSAPALYRNDLVPPAGPEGELEGEGGSEAGGAHFLALRLDGGDDSPLGYGARVTVCAGGRCQLQVLGLSSNFSSHQPPELHFGLGAAETADEVRVEWPDGVLEVHRDLPAGFLTLARGPAFDIPVGAPALALLAALLAAAGAAFLHRSAS